MHHGLEPAREGCPVGQDVDARSCGVTGVSDDLAGIREEGIQCIEARRGDSRLLIALGRALAGSGKREEAVRAAQRAVALAPVSANLAKATASMGGAAEIYAYLGETDAALRLLEQLLRMPAGRDASVPLLRADPAFDRLRADPRFARMLARFAPG